ncbi:cytochrome P450 [Bailinhaonella thermotolerans]|uniref:Cytochrome P450 n=1 Tax=Bailinhaonella thermotolerans TaxID=1070861 RepID=A0A3A4BCH6_9ACTN|nr:cytochrome P450 [Bailinhaonella thermotolerans]RJL35806.1 cytochrome P450 [Bailinhaonella thermotolerans]
MTVDDRTSLRYPFCTEGHRLHPRMDELRREGPVVRVTTNAGSPAWLVIGWEEARRVLRDPVFSRSQVADPGGPVQDAPIVAPELLAVMDYLNRAGLGDEVRRSLTDLPDLPDAWLAGEARAALGAMLRDGAPGDLQRLAARVAGRSMCRLLGLPYEDLPLLIPWADIDLTMYLPPADTERNWLELRDHLRERLSSGDAASSGLLPRLAALNDASPAPLTRDEFANIAGVLFVAGYENLSSFLGTASVALLRRRISLLSGDLRGHVEELLRSCPLLGNALARIVTRDVELAGVPLRAGELVLVDTDSANHDPAAFRDPHRFDPRRNPNPHVRFGHGPYYCVGAQVARRLAAIVLGELARLPGLRLAVPPEEIEWHRDRMAIMPKAVPVQW